MARGKKITIWDRRELEIYFWQMITRDAPEGKWSPAGVSGRLKYELDGVATEFQPYYEMRVRLKDVRVEWWRKQQRPMPLIVTVRLHKQVVAECRHLGVCCADLTGRMYLRTQTVRLNELGNPKLKFRTGGEDKHVFAGKSSRLAALLLENPVRRWNIPLLQKATGLSMGRVWELVDYYDGQGWVHWRRRRELRLVDAEGLLTVWRDACIAAELSLEEREVPGGLRLVRREGRRRFELHCYSRAGDPKEIAVDLQRRLGKIRFTQRTGWSLRMGRGLTDELTLYAPRFLALQEMKDLGFLRATKRLGNVRILRPADIFFLDFGRDVDGFPVSMDEIIYLDLATVDETQELAEEFRRWEGFGSLEYEVSKSQGGVGDQPPSLGEFGTI
jgi:hypothetical protein